MSFLSLHELLKTFPDGTEAVKGIDLSIERGEFVVLLGPSGCGKTTTLRMIAGLEIPTAGSIVLDGEDVTKLRPSQRDVGFVFQFYALYPHLSVRQNIAFPLVSVGTKRREVEARVNEVAGRVGLSDLLDRAPQRLSGGDQQRVALARAMVRSPRVWLMDEPLGTLDADRRVEMREFIRKQQLDMKITTIYVTHDQEEAMSLADRIVVMDGGIIRQIGSPDEVYDRPADLFVANFIGSPGMNFIKGRIDESGRRFVGNDGAGIELGRTVRAGEVMLGIRPEHVMVASDGGLPARVLVEEYLGSYRLMHVDVPGLGRLVLRVDTALLGSDHREVPVKLDPAHINLFDVISGMRI